LTIGRDLIILFGGTLYRIFFGPFEIKPSLISKANTAMQVVTLILIMLYLLPSASVQLPLLAQLGEYLGGSTEQWVDPYCLWLLAMLGAVSGAHYVVVWGARARRELTRRKQAEVIAREGSSDS